MKFISKNKIILIALLVLAILIPITAAHAQSSFIENIAYSVIGKFFLGISWLVGVVVGFFLMVAGWFIETFMQLNEGIVNSYVVQLGFKVTLSIANLAFVAGIIVIAIATILRKETYGIKKILWKLITAAILVNFSLVLAGALINFSDQVTRSFMNSAFPVDGGGTSINQFSMKMMNAFAPQKMTDSVSTALKNATTTATGVSPQVEKELSGGGEIGKSIGAIISPLMSTIMTAIGLIMMLIVMATFAFMLLARYVILTFLLILTPLIWAAWIFPSTEKFVGQWTNMFFKWTFFGPLVVFSMWLVITMGGEIQNGHVAILKEVSYNSPGGAGAGISDFFGNLLSGIMSPFLNGIVLVGLMVGGLMMANKLGIAGAKAGMAGIDKVRNSVQGYATRKGRQAGSAIARTKLGQKAAQTLQRTAPNWGANKKGALGFLQRTVASGARGLTAPVRAVGSGMQSIAVGGGEKLVEEAKKRISSMTTDQKIDALAGADAQTSMAILDDLSKAGALGRVPAPILNRVLANENEDQFKRYNQSKLYEQLRDKTHLKSRELIAEREAAEKMTDGEEKKKEIERVENEIKRLHARTRDFAGIELFYQDLGDDKTKEETLKKAGLDEEEYKKLQEFYAEAVVSTYSGGNVSKFHQQMAMEGDLDEFNKVRDRIKIKPDEYSDQYKNYTDSSAAKSLGIASMKEKKEREGGLVDSTGKSTKESPRMEGERSVRSSKSFKI